MNPHALLPANPAAPTRKRATAFIIRRDPVPALLVYFHPDIQAGLYLLGGGINPDESPVMGIRREVEEESGLDVSSLTLVRTLEVFAFYKPFVGKNIERHDFVFLAPLGLPQRWSHLITLSKDDDLGLTHEFQWLTAAECDRIHPDFREQVTPAILPELFGSA